jgi:hypothetical protein
VEKATQNFGSLFGYPRRFEFMLKHIKHYLVIDCIPVYAAIDFKKNSTKFWCRIWVFKKASFTL